MSKNNRLKKRLAKDRPMTAISLRMPADVLDDLKEIAATLGFRGYQPLIRFYIGQSLRKDLARRESGPVALMAESLRRHGVSDAVIEEALAEAMTKGQVRSELEMATDTQARTGAGNPLYPHNHSCRSADPNMTEKTS